MDRDLIERYEHGGEKLELAIRGLTRDDLRAVPVPGMWSIAQLVIHLMDSDLVLSDRIKRVIAEDRPPLLAYDESAWAARLHYELQSVEDAVRLFALNRRMTAAILRLLPDDAASRKGVHSERGDITLGDLLQTAVDHLDHHLKFLYDKREKMGKLMW